MRKLKHIKYLFPVPMRKRFAWVMQFGRIGHWLKILSSQAPEKDKVTVFYGHEHIPRPGEVTHGGMVKFQRMQDLYLNSPYRFNTLYMVSSRRPVDAVSLSRLARYKGARFVWNQNGVGYPGWHGPGWELYNRPMAKLLHAADYVFYQSEFCKLSADRFLGERQGPWEILYNAVDTSLFTPATDDPDPHRLVLLLGGSQMFYYRLESALRTVALLVRQRPDVRLLVTGKLGWTYDEAKAMQMAQALITELGIVEHVTFLGPYTQQEAPTIFHQAQILLHTQYNDACPGLVVEAMACGLPVVYSHSGGVPELVGDEAGIGVASQPSWEQIFPPDPSALAEAVLQVAAQRQKYAQAARQRAVEHFDLKPWLERHCEVFEGLLNSELEPMVLDKKR